MIITTYVHVYIFYVPLNSCTRLSLHACNAMSPDEQLNVLKDMWKKQKTVEVVIRKEDDETINYYMNEVS